MNYKNKTDVRRKGEFGYDPDSVVREGEQLQVQGLGGLESQARSLLSRIGITQDGTHEGGRLIIDPVIRAQIRQAAADRYATLTLGQLDLEEFTGSEGSMAGLTPDFFRSKLSGDGSMKRPYIVRSYDDLPEKAKTGDYAIVNGVFEKIEVQ